MYPLSLLVQHAVIYGRTVACRGVGFNEIQGRTSGNPINLESQREFDKGWYTSSLWSDMPLHTEDVWIQPVRVVSRSILMVLLKAPGEHTTPQMTLFRVSLTTPRCASGPSDGLGVTRKRERPRLDEVLVLRLCDTSRSLSSHGQSGKNVSARSIWTMPLCLRSSQSHNKSTGRCAETQPVSRFILTPDATVTNTRPAFHLRELPLGGRQTSPEPLCVCSSHPRRDVSLTHSPAGLVYRTAPTLSCWSLQRADWKEAESNNDSHALQSPCARSAAVAPLHRFLQPLWTSQIRI